GLRMDLDVPPVRAPAHGAPLAGTRLLERGVDVFSDLLDPRRGESTLADDDPVGLQPVPDPVHLELWRRALTAHGIGRYAWKPSLWLGAERPRPTNPRRASPDCHWRSNPVLTRCCT